MSLIVEAGDLFYYFSQKADGLRKRKTLDSFGYPKQKLIEYENIVIDGNIFRS